MTPLEFFRLQTREEVLAHYDRFAPVGVEELDLAAAGGRVLAAPISGAGGCAGVFPRHHGRLRASGPRIPSGPASGRPSTWKSRARCPWG